MGVQTLNALVQVLPGILHDHVVSTKLHQGMAIVGRWKVGNSKFTIASPAQLGWSLQAFQQA